MEFKLDPSLEISSERKNGKGPIPIKRIENTSNRQVALVVFSSRGRLYEYASNRNVVGESLGALSLRELKNLEGRVEIGISKIRSKKNELLFAEIEYMEKREMNLHHNNPYLRAKLAETEQSHQQQHMNLMPGGSGSGFELAQPAFDARVYL